MTTEIADPPVIVPTARTCENCACAKKDNHPRFGPQLFCRRETANTTVLRVKVPVIRDGNPIPDKNRPGKFVEREEDALFYLYRPTLPELTCFDGWRPIGTEPGDFSYKSSAVEAKFIQGFDRLMRDLSNDAQLAALEAIDVARDGKKN